MINVQPVTPAAPYIGGKRLLSRKIVPMIEAIPHALYAEPFIGMGGVFFTRREIPKAEIINDRSGDVVNLFRILQRHYPQFMETFKFQVTSRREFERLRKIDPATLTDLERAARFLYLQRTGFGGKVEGRTFGIDRERGSRLNLLKLAPLLEDIHERLADVIIENLDWLMFIEKYDRAGTLFYLDPPYWGVEGYYGKGMFDRAQFIFMARALARLKGSFIMSINNVPEIKELFSAFTIIEAQVRYSCSGNNNHIGKDLIITNRPEGNE